MCPSKLFLGLKRFIPLLISTLILSILITPTGAVVLAQDEEPEQPGEILPDVPELTPEPLDEIPQPPDPNEAEGIFEQMDTDLLPSNFSTTVIGIPYLVHDIYGGAASSNPNYLTVLNDKLWFGAYDGDTYVGRELWAYNGSETYRAADLNPGSNSSWPQPATGFKGWLFMAADTGDGKGTELTAWNGTTAKRYDIRAGSSGSYPRYMTVFDSNYSIEKLYFAANGGDAKGGTELWALDCVYCTPYRVADIWTGTRSSTPTYLEVYASRLWFSANGGNGKGRELWVYNGQGAPKMAADICSGSSSSSPAHLQVFGDRMYFGADGCDGKGRELWSQYFNYASPGRVSDIRSGLAGSDPAWLTDFYNHLLFFSADGGDGKGVELWAYNGSTAPVRAADIYPGFTGSNPTHLAAYKDRLYLNADSGDGKGRELRAISIVPYSLWWITSNAGYDGWVLESSETSNAGGSINSSSSFFRLGDDDKDRQYRATLHFNTSGLPDNAVIVGTLIRIKQYSKIGTDPFSTHNKLMMDVRNSAFSGKFILQPSDFEASPNSWNAGGNTIHNPGDLWYAIPLTTSNFKYINKKGVTQFRLRFYKPDNDDMNADYINFISANAATAANHPQLIITYYVP